MAVPARDQPDKVQPWHQRFGTLSSDDVSDATKWYRKRILPGATSPITVLSVGAGDIVEDCLVKILTVDADATLDVGDDDDADGFLPTAVAAPAVAGWKGGTQADQGVYLFDATVGDRMYLRKVYTAAKTVRVATTNGNLMEAEVFIKVSRLANVT